MVHNSGYRYKVVFKVSFFLLFLPLDPDPDPESETTDPFESGSDPDLDPQHWYQPTILVEYEYSVFPRSFYVVPFPYKLNTLGILSSFQHTHTAPKCFRKLPSCPV